MNVICENLKKLQLHTSTPTYQYIQFIDGKIWDRINKQFGYRHDFYTPRSNYQSYTLDTNECGLHRVVNSDAANY